MFIHVLTEKEEIFPSSLSMSINPSSELYSEESTEDVADVDSLYQQSVSSSISNP